MESELSAYIPGPTPTEDQTVFTLVPEDHEIVKMRCVAFNYINSPRFVTGGENPTSMPDQHRQIIIWEETASFYGLSGLIGTPASRFIRFETCTTSDEPNDQGKRTLIIHLNLSMLDCYRELITRNDTKLCFDVTFSWVCGDILPGWRDVVGILRYGICCTYRKDGQLIEIRHPRANRIILTER